MRSYAIGDIHGYLDQLTTAHRLIEADRARTGDTDAPIVHVGDLCDRGPDTRGVIDHLMAGQARGENWVVLKGNHDRMFASFMHSPPRRDPLRDDLFWLDAPLGGRRTLASYGVDADRDVMDIHAEARAKIPEAHLEFVRSAPASYRRGEAFFCHAGIRPGVPLDAQSEDDLVWIRGEFLTSTADHGPLIVHGHTVTDAATHYGNRLNIDSGAGYGQPISAVVLEGRDAFLLTEQGRKPLAPL
ncbi:metallophosphoesterase [Maritimibacter sp. DP1N21-5]|uniref:metallophosphoesterase n=1 Tax=Maritimibacter sp. DP1N21-5 TaxID=2836867 RepID=UPI001C4785AE|nr:metallophosphoesterase [Maritimibacter sp. DP1N21-5]MBV7407918.1 metallophosphoesterase [Maritimibacter sp. DP1N21-5]